MNCKDSGGEKGSKYCIIHSYTFFAGHFPRSHIVPVLKTRISSWLGDIVHCFAILFQKSAECVILNQEINYIHGKGIVLHNSDVSSGKDTKRYGSPWDETVSFVCKQTPIILAADYISTGKMYH